MSRAWQPWQARWLETEHGRTRARQRGFPRRGDAEVFADRLAGDPGRDTEKIRVVRNRRKGIT